MECSAWARGSARIAGLYSALYLKTFQELLFVRYVLLLFFKHVVFDVAERDMLDELV